MREFFLQSLMTRLPSLVGIFVVFVCLLALSVYRRGISWKLVMNTALVHLVLGCIMLHWSWGQIAIGAVASGVNALYQAADIGSTFLFGALAQPAAGGWGFVFAFRALPIIVFFGALMALLSYFGVVNFVVSIIKRLLQPLWGTRGAETTCAVANSFLGQTEAPLLVKEYLSHMSESCMFLVMVSGMGTITVGLIAMFGAMGVPLQHLLAASIMAIPATVMCAKMVYPEKGDTTCPEICADIGGTPPASYTEAIARGTSDGLMLALNVGAMLIAFLSLIGLINMVLGYISPLLTLEKILGYLFVPFGWMMGFGGEQALKIGELVGMKIVANETVAYSALVKSGLSERAVMLATYALCGFSNFSSIGIQVGGIGALAPAQRSVLSRLGVRAVFTAALANLYSAFVVNLIF